jgi:YidC/Oxa1 family membrane protein insertase
MMSEQQRVLLAVTLCVGIFITWQFLFVPPPGQPDPNAHTVEGSAETNPTKNVKEASEATQVDKAGGAEQVGAGSVTNAEGATELDQGHVPVVEVPIEVLPFRSSDLEISVTNGNDRRAQLQSIRLLKFTESSESPDGDQISNPVTLTGEKEFAAQAPIHWDWDQEQPKMGLRKDGSAYVFDGVAHGVEFKVKLEPITDTFGFNYTVSVTNKGNQAQSIGAKLRLQLPPQEKAGGFLSPQMDQTQAMCGLVDDVEGHTASDLEDEPWRSETAVRWAGIDRQYFVLAAHAEEPEGTFCELQSVKGSLLVDYGFARQKLEQGKSVEKKFLLYLGPKRDRNLVAVSPALVDVVDYSIMGIPLGFLARPMVFLLSMFHGWTASWGVAIFLLTLLVKLLLFPVTYKSVVSMRRMQLLKPELDKLKEQYKNDRERQQLEQMKLFRERGVNPLGGCLPMLLQMPVWFALYRMLWSAVDLYNQPFLWISNLTAAEPFPTLALLVGALTFVQQKLTPTSVESQQQKMMMYMMPIMFTVFMIALPSGLVLYIMYNSILTIIQQAVINKRTTL